MVALIMVKWIKNNVEKDNQMNCSIVDCPGEYEQREVVRAVRQGNRIIVIEHIPAEVM